MPTLKSVLKPPESITVGLAEVGAVFLIYQAALPNHADIRSAPAHNTDIEAARKKAAWTSASVLGFVYLLTRDLNSFLIGGLALAGIDFLAKHGNGISPATGRLSVGDPGSAVQDAGDNAAAFPLPDYADASMSYAG